MPLANVTDKMVNSPAKKPATKKGSFLTRALSAGGMRASKTVSAKEELIRAYTKAMIGGDMTPYFTEDATFSPPGATLPIGAVSGMMAEMAKVFPQWESKVLNVEEQPDGTCKAYTQQRIGVMKADLPALGPFPAVKLADASARIKAVPTILPVEVGIVRFNAEGTKVTAVDYSAATIAETLDATTMDLKEPVGFPCLFELMGVEMPAPPAAPAAPVFFSVVHTFNEGQAEGFWAMLGGMSEADQAAMHAKWHEMGYHNHSFIPTSPTGLVNCLWEAKAGTTPETFQAFIDGPDGPGPGIFTNAVHTVMDGAVMPSSYFNEAPPPPTMPTTGSFFWVYHTFKAGAAEGFWSMIGGMGPDDFAAMGARHHSLGFHNHSFAPCAVEGPCICIWESKEPMTAEAFQAFIDGPDGPGAGAVFVNDVHAAMAGAALPPAFFPQPSVVQHRINRIPIVAGAMPKIVEVARSSEFKDQVSGFDGLIDVDVLAIDDTTMMSHSRWVSAAYATAAAAAIGKVLGGALKPFIAGPPSPVVGHAAWSLAGGASRALAAPAVRLTTLSLKEGAFEDMLGEVRQLEDDFKALQGLVRIDALRMGPDSLLVAAEYTSMAALDAAAPKIQAVMRGLAPHLAEPPEISAGTVAWTLDAAATKEQARRAANIARVQHLVGEFMAGRPEGYMAGVADDIKGSILGGLLPGAEAVANKAEFGALMGSMDQYMEVRKFEPSNWRAVGDDVLFNVDWTFVWKATGETVDTTALVRKVVRDGLICEKYHMIDGALIERLTGKPAPHSAAPVERVQALLAEYGAGNPAGYLAGVSDDMKADVLGGLIPGGDAIADKAAFAALMGGMEEYMEVRKFEPYNFRAMPNSDMIFNVDWEFVWKMTGKLVATTAICRKVLKEVDGALQICEKYHMVDAACIAPEPPQPTAADCVVCPPCNTPPSKAFGEAGAQAKMWMTRMIDGRQAARIIIEPGFDWRSSIKPLLPGCPEWCPATHFGYLESGTMGVRFMDGTEKVINAGETYLIPPGHLPFVEKDPAVMVEFSQDPTYAKLAK